MNMFVCLPKCIMCLCLHVCMCLCICLCVCVFVCVCLCVCDCIHKHMCACVTYVSLYVYLYVYICKTARYILIKKSVIKTWISYSFKFTVSFNSQNLKILFINYCECIQLMLIILDSISELEIALNHQPFSDHFMNLPS